MSDGLTRETPREVELAHRLGMAEHDKDGLIARAEAAEARVAELAAVIDIRSNALSRVAGLKAEVARMTSWKDDCVRLIEKYAGRIAELEAEVARLRAALRDLLACYSDSPPISAEHAEAQASAHHEALIAARAALAPAEEVNDE